MRDAIVIGHSTNLQKMTESGAPVVIDETSDASVLLSLENLLKQNAVTLDRLNKEITKKSEMLSSALINDEGYRDLLDKVKKINKERLALRYKIMCKQENKPLIEDVKNLKADRKELRGAQSDYLRELQRMSGATQLELFDSTVMEIVTTYKLVKMRKR